MTAPDWKARALRAREALESLENVPLVECKTGSRRFVEIEWEDFQTCLKLFRSALAEGRAPLEPQVG